MIVRVLNSDALFDIKQAALITLGKEVDKKDLKKTPFTKQKEYYINRFLENHSIVRSIHIRITDTIRKDCLSQIIRATKGHPQPYVQSGRPDWTGKERSRDPAEKRMFVMDFTPESFIAMCHQRLCRRAMRETREIVESWVYGLSYTTNPLLQALAYCCVPNCVYLGGCPEAKSCGREKGQIEIKQRYDKYQQKEKILWGTKE